MLFVSRCCIHDNKTVDGIDGHKSYIRVLLCLLPHRAVHAPLQFCAICFEEFRDLAFVPLDLQSFILPIGIDSSHCFFCGFGLHGNCLLASAQDTVYQWRALLLDEDEQLSAGETAALSVSLLLRNRRQASKG